ncbi:hypothetical protein [Comamonas faecalis]|uniref:hypothetical protein n=1 Tax=Comamonas faecalis TaxID=1387849 RepID=UPI0031ECBDEE
MNASITHTGADLAGAADALRQLDRAREECARAMTVAQAVAALARPARGAGKTAGPHTMGHDREIEARARPCAG